MNYFENTNELQKAVFNALEVDLEGKGTHGLDVMITLPPEKVCSVRCYHSMANEMDIVELDKIPFYNNHEKVYVAYEFEDYQLSMATESGISCVSYKASEFDGDPVVILQRENYIAKNEMFNRIYRATKLKEREYVFI